MEHQYSGAAGGAHRCEEVGGGVGVNVHEACSILLLILTRVVGDGGLEGDLIGYWPCNNTALVTLTHLNSLFYMF